MDAYEATKVVLGRIQAVDPENAANIMGLLLLQDHGEKEMIRLAFGPEPLLLSAVAKARNDLGLPPLSPFRHNQDKLVSPSSNPTATSSFYGGRAGDLVDELRLQDELGFLNDGAGERGLFSSYPMGWSGIHRRSYSAAELCVGAEVAGGYGWRPCLYFARGYCKNGSSCRFIHGLPDDTPALVGERMDAAVGQQCQELLLRSKSQRLGGASSLMASAFPYSPTGSVPPSPSSSSKAVNFLLQQQQSESQRVAAAAAALMLGGDEAHKFMARSPRIERSDFAGMVNPGSRQIYLTFPADSTFREEDVSNYFSIYGPVQDVRIPYQQKRMFGFVTFVYPETVKLILAKGNPHFVRDARVLVKPYKEKGKVPDKKQQQQGEKGDYSGCSTPTGLDARDAFDLQQLGAARMLYGSINQEALLRRRLEEQQQAEELQQAIEMQSRRFMGFQFLDLKSRSLPSTTTLINSRTISTPTDIPIHSDNRSSRERGSVPSLEDKSQATAAAAGAATATTSAIFQTAVNTGADEEQSVGEARPNEDSGFQESAEHNLPDSPFASPTKSSLAMGAFSAALESDITATTSSPHNSGSHLLAASSLLPSTPTLDMASFKSCFSQMPRFSSGHGAVGM